MSHAHYQGAPQARRGRLLKVKTNSFEITRLPSVKFIQYEAIKPEFKFPNSRRSQEIVERLQNHTAPEVFNPRCVYDGAAILYSSHRLNLPAGNAGSFEVSMSDRAPPADTAVRPRGTFTVTLTRVDHVVDFDELNALITGKLKVQTPNSIVATNLLQFLIRQAPNMTYPHNARAYYTSVNSKPIGGGLELWRGYFQSVRPTVGRMLINIDISTTAMIRGGPLVEIALDALMVRNFNPRSLVLTPDQPQFRKLKSFFKGVMITVKTNPRAKKRITGLEPRAGKFEFDREEKNGDFIHTTVEEYYRHAYNVRLNHPDIIGVRIGPRNVIPAELCTVLPGQLYKQKVPPELTKSVVEFATKKPHERLRMITDGVGQGPDSIRSPVLEYPNSDFIRNAGMSISAQPVTIEGRVLDPPIVTFSANSVKPRDGSWNLQQQRFRKPSSIHVWAIVDYSLNKSEPRAKAFAEMLVQCLRNLGMKIGPLGCYRQGMGAASVASDLWNAGAEALGSRYVQDMPENERPKAPTLIIVIIPGSGTDIRIAVKQFGDILHGVPTQCIKEEKLNKLSMQYCSNVALKINVRIGGENMVATSAALQKVQNQPYMVIGADIGHPGPGVHTQPSIASLVWSYDVFAVKYIAFSRVQRPRQEKIEDLEELMAEALKRFGEINNAFPVRIFFFRDGVSEGEYATTSQYELDAIEKAIDVMWEEKKVRSPKPKITFIIVGKRHHVRFFPTQQGDADRSGNCPAGFVADRGISNPVAKDFYLQSHGGLLGTSRPSHYVVLKDDNFMNDVEELQEFSFTLCHSYARATRSVSIPAPVYYADIVCARANFHFDPSLKFDAGGTVSSENAQFNLNEWKRGFRNLHRNMTTSMYFM